MVDSYEEWVEFLKKPGAISTVMSSDWLLRGCPKCGCKTWQVTMDAWAYCDGCLKGYSMYTAITNRPLMHFDEHGLHCFMCKGYGVRDGETCDECNGHFITQPKKDAPND